MAVQLSRVKEDKYFVYSRPRTIKAPSGWKIYNAIISSGNRYVTVYLRKGSPKDGQTQSMRVSARAGWKIRTDLIGADNKSIIIQSWRWKK